MLTDEQVETYLRCTIGDTSELCKKCMNFEKWDETMHCPFGPRQAKALLTDRADLKAENASFRALVEAHEEVKAQLKAENERLRAVVEATLGFLDYIHPLVPKGKALEAAALAALEVGDA